MEIQEAKTEILGAIDSRLKQYEAQVKTAGDAAASTTTELKNLSDRFADIIEKQTKLDENQGVLIKQADALEMWAKRQNQSFDQRIKGFYEDLKEKADAASGDLAALGTRKSRSVNFDLEHGQDYVSQKAVGNITTSLSATGTLPVQMAPNVVMPQNRKVHIRSLIPSTPMTAVNYSYPKFTDGEGTPAIQTEGSAKAQGDLDVQYITLNPVVIAYWMRVSEQMLSDIPRLLSVISNRMVEQLLNVEDNEILNGPGGNNRLNGIITQATAFAPQGSANKSNADRYNYILSALSQLAQTNYMASGIVVNPYSYYEFMQVKTTTNDYTAPLSGITWIDNTLRLAGVPVYQTTAMAQNSFVVGDWNQAEFLVKDAMQVDLSREDNDNFTKNLVTVRVEERVGLAVYYPQAFLYGSFNAISS